MYDNGNNLEAAARPAQAGQAGTATGGWTREHGVVNHQRARVRRGQGGSCRDGVWQGVRGPGRA